MGIVCSLNGRHVSHTKLSFSVNYSKCFQETNFVLLCSTVIKKSPLCAERRYQPIRIAYLLSLAILIGASSEISGAEKAMIFRERMMIFEIEKHP